MVGDNKIDTSIQALFDKRYSGFVRLAEGGMGAIYRAHDEVLDIDVAIKTLLIDKMTSDMVLRFQQEARAASKLRHPNLITVLDFGMTKQNYPYLIMEFVNGHPLEDDLEKGRKFSLEEALPILIEVCRGMSHAHKNGVIHRDLKPSNVMIVESTAGDTGVKVVDFGVAKLKEESDQSITRTGRFVGSPSYMSPEQIKGEEVDERTDIYSLGCLIHRMLNGAVPFVGETNLETFKQHLENEPPLLEAADMTDQFQEFVDKCLQKSSADRFASMDEVIEELLLHNSKFVRVDRITQEEVPKVFSTSARDKLRGESNRVKLLATICFVVFIGFSISLFLYLRQNPASTESGQVQKAKEEQLYDTKPALRADFLDRGEGFKISPDGKVVVALERVHDAHLKNLAREKRITELTLENSHVTSEGLRWITGMKLKHLDLTNTPVDDDAAKYISQIKTLRVLFLARTKFTDAAVVEFAKLKEVQSINFDDCPGITDRGLHQIIENWPNLKVLNIGETKVTANGLKEVQKLRNLESLEMAMLPVNDELMDIVDTLPITYLNFNRSPVQPNLVKRLARIKRLKILVLTGTNLQHEGVDWLQKQLPGCKIVFDENVKNKDFFEFGEFLGERGDGEARDGTFEAVNEEKKSSPKSDEK